MPKINQWYTVMKFINIINESKKLNYYIKDKKLKISKKNKST